MKKIWSATSTFLLGVAATLFILSQFSFNKKITEKITGKKNTTQMDSS